MKLITKAAAMALATCTIAAAQPSDAHAAKTLLDLLRGNSGSERSSSRNARDTASSADVDPEPISRVSSPRYYTYKAESFRALNVPDFVEPMVTKFNELIGHYKPARGYEFTVEAEDFDTFKIHGRPQQTSS